MQRTGSNRRLWRGGPQRHHSIFRSVIIVYNYCLVFQARLVLSLRIAWPIFVAGEFGTVTTVRRALVGVVTSDGCYQNERRHGAITALSPRSLPQNASLSSSRQRRLTESTSAPHSLRWEATVAF